MKAVTYHGKHDVRVEEVARPSLRDPRDAIIRVTSTAICGSDLHIYDRAVLGMKKGDIMGHEFMGVVEEVGAAVTHVAVGDRVIVPFVIACGTCQFCTRGLVSLCDESNPNAKLVEPIYGHSPAGFFGYTHLFGGYDGGQAEYVRVPYADFGFFAIPDHISDDQALFLTDILPTGYMAALNCEIQQGDTVLVAGAGPVGQFAALSAKILGAGDVIVVDRFPDRLAKVEELTGAITINYKKKNVQKEIRKRTGGDGPHSAIDAVGMEAHGGGLPGVYDRVKQRLRMHTDRPTALRQVIKAVRKGGTVSIPGVYAGVSDKFPIGAVFGKGLTMTGGQTHVHTYVPELLALIDDKTIDPSQIITQHMPLEEAPDAYRRFKDKEPGFLKVVLKP